MLSDSCSPLNGPVNQFWLHGRLILFLCRCVRTQQRKRFCGLKGGVENMSNFEMYMPLLCNQLFCTNSPNASNMLHKPFSGVWHLWASNMCTGFWESTWWDPPAWSQHSCPPHQDVIWIHLIGANVHADVSIFSFFLGPASLWRGSHAHTAICL